MKVETLAIVISVLIFIITTVFNYLHIIDDRKKRWYQEIIIGSNIEKIDVFFKDILLEFKVKKSRLNHNHNHITNKYLEEKAKLTHELNKIKNKFNFEVLPVFKSFDINLSIRLSDCLDRFQDVYTSGVGLECKKNDNDLIEDLIEVKSDFYNILYQPTCKSFVNTISIETLLLFFLLLFFIFVFLSDIFFN